jgi:hypothetical protein
MTTTSPATAARARIAEHQLEHPGVPTPLPFPLTDCRLRPNLEQQQANLLHVAIWIVEYDQDHLVMETFHDQPDPGYQYLQLPTGYHLEDDYNHCGTTHCIAGFAQFMAGPAAFLRHPASVAGDLLGDEAYKHFSVDEATALGYLRTVIAAGEEGPEA